MYALECAMDELALRARHGPDRAARAQRARGRPRDRACRSARATSSRACARARSASAGTGATRRPACGATAAGWSARASRPRPTRRGAAPSSAPRARTRTARSSCGIGAADIGTGARTVLTQIAADALEVPLERVRVEIGDSALPRGDARGRLDGHGLVGLGDRQGAARALREQLDGRTARSPPRGSRPRPTPATTSGPGAVRPPRVRRPVRRGARRTPTPARCASRGCSACSPRGGSSTR